MNKKRLIPMIFIAGLTASANAGEKLNGEQLRKVIIGNTESGTYEWEGQKSGYYEYYSEDGSISGRDRWEAYEGTYEIRSDGCFYGDYEGSEFDGCYYYEHASGNSYRVYNPDGTSSLVEILKGNPKGL